MQCPEGFSGPPAQTGVHPEVPERNHRNPSQAGPISRLGFGICRYQGAIGNHDQQPAKAGEGRTNPPEREATDTSAGAQASGQGKHQDDDQPPALRRRD
jgi:hypothetical protein